MDVSLLHFYSYGYSAENKSRNSHDLEVFLAEKTPFTDGEVVNNATEIEDTGVDHEGKSYSVKVTTDNSIKCTWLPYGSNRLTSPDIRRGEGIIVLRYGDTDKFYWVPDGRYEQLRRLETVIWRFSNTRDEGDKAINDKNSYNLTVSTHDKHITLKTSKNDGEPFEYVIQLNTKEGILAFADDVGNYMEMNSRDTIITLENSEKSKLILNKTKAYFETIDEINLKTKTYNIDVTDMNINATNITTKATKIDTTTSTYDISASTFKVSATITFTGGTTITGNVSTTGTLTNNGKAAGSTHYHAHGTPNTSPPLN